MRKYIVPVRMTEQEYVHLKKLSDASGLSHSQIIRNAVSECEIPTKPERGLKELYMAVNRIGVNINQIARKANAGIANRKDIHELLFLMRKIDARMAKISDG